MINKLISKSQVRVLNCENCPNEDYARGYTRAISDVLDLETIPTLGVDTLEKIKAEIKEKCDEINYIVSDLPYSKHRAIQELLCEILDNIGKAESEK